MHAPSPSHLPCALQPSLSEHRSLQVLAKASSPHAAHPMPEYPPSAHSVHPSPVHPYTRPNIGQTPKHLSQTNSNCSEGYTTQRKACSAESCARATAIAAEGGRPTAYLIADARAIPVAPPVCITAHYERTPLRAGARECVLATSSAPDACMSCVLALARNVA